METKWWSGIAFGFREKIPVSLNPELPFETERVFPQALPVSSTCLQLLAKPVLLIAIGIKILKNGRNGPVVDRPELCDLVIREYRRHVRVLPPEVKVPFNRMHDHQEQGGKSGLLSCDAVYYLWSNLSEKSASSFFRVKRMTLERCIDIGMEYRKGQSLAVKKKRESRVILVLRDERCGASDRLLQVQKGRQGVQNSPTGKGLGWWRVQMRGGVPDEPLQVENVGRGATFLK
jgi:hypothetical protein